MDKGRVAPKVNMLDAGEQGLVVDFGNAISLEINMVVQRLVKVLTNRQEPGITEVMPTYRSAMVYFDPLLISRAELTALVGEILEDIGASDDSHIERRVIRVPVCYGGVFGPDIDYVARRTGLPVEEVVRIHSSRAYLIYMLGFTPGFPYLGGLPEELAVPRLEKMRTKIPAGSVGIAGSQTGFYPVESPGGWRLIGRTPLNAFNPEHAYPFIFAAGDYLQFKAVTVDEFFAIRREVDAGTYVPEVTGLQ